LNSTIHPKRILESIKTRGNESNGENKLGSEERKRNKKYKHKLLIFNSTLIDAKKLRKKDRREKLEECKNVSNKMIKTINES